MKRRTADLALIFVAMIWGTTFVIVQNAVAFLPPFAFNSLRFLLAALFLLGWMRLTSRKRLPAISQKIWLKGILLGFWLYLGYGFQTLGLVYTTSSKTAFITGLSVVLVPVMAIFILKQHMAKSSIISVILAVSGLYLLTMGSSFDVNRGDFYVLLCAFSFGLHIVFTSKFARGTPALLLTFIQLATVTMLSLASSFLFENWRSAFQLDLILKEEVLAALIITSLFATALAFLTQTYFQSYTTPARVALIFALEPVFGALTAYFVANETLNSKGFIGCILIFIGMILAELPLGTLFKKKISFHHDI